MLVSAAVRTPTLARPSIVFAGAAMLSGIVATFLPAALPHTGDGFIAIALLVHAVTGTAARWWAGLFGDRHGAHRLLVPGVVAGATGLSALVVTTHPVAVLIGMAVFGAGFGAGALGFGLLATTTGYPVGFAAAAALSVVALVALHPRRIR
ncbi:hypothetical protein Ais01nite_43380 [Asanoa ishikariensis]|uniref:hypothetical protein n=1 Tax=Asanoa ishikariensis TaxID=137265 RepID=UPI000B89012C|nr:hypothetical protein [Asanoa ishikariensis]GIF66303.1 hypothetical protein Ais01nite_43380 [Asanoa ishikariensis]